MMIELPVVDASEKFNRIVHEMCGVIYILVQEGERTRESDKPAAGQGSTVQGTAPRRKSIRQDKRTTQPLHYITERAHVYGDALHKNFPTNI